MQAHEQAAIDEILKERDRIDREKEEAERARLEAIRAHEARMADLKQMFQQRVMSDAQAIVADLNQILSPRQIKFEVLEAAVFGTKEQASSFLGAQGAAAQRQGELGGLRLRMHVPKTIQLRGIPTLNFVLKEDGNVYVTSDDNFFGVLKTQAEMDHIGRDFVFQQARRLLNRALTERLD
jgi:hypothetical protein